MTNGHGEKYQRLRHQAVVALLEHATIGRAAASVGIDESTMRQWLGRAGFTHLYRRARRQLVEAALGRLQQAMAQAVDALTRNLACGHPGTEVRAAAVLLQQGTAAVELYDVEDRLARLERA